MNRLEHFNEFGDSAFYSKVLFLIDELPSTDINEGFFGPLSEPIDCRTVDQGREHSQSGCELVAQWRHYNDHVNVSLDSDQILGEDVGFCWRKTFLRAISLTSCRDILHIFLLVDTGYVATVENVVDVFQHLLVDDLSVTE